MMQDPEINELDAMLHANGGRVFPNAIPTQNGTIYAPGMSLRDWFAGQALAGLLADHTLDLGFGEYAEKSYRMANAMLAARAKEPGA